MLVHSLFVLLCFILDSALAIIFPTNYLFFGTIFIPSLGLCALVLCSRDMERLDAILFSFLVGMFYDFFFAGTFLLYALIFAILAFLASLWKNHLFNSVLECFVICAAALFFKDLITFFIANSLAVSHLSFSSWITRYEAGNIFFNLILSIFVIALYFAERRIIKGRNKRLRSSEKIHWYEALGGKKMKRLMSILLVLSICVFSITSCARKEAGIAVTTYPVEYLVTRIADKTVSVNNLSTGDFYQDMELRSDAAEIIKKSDAVFYIKGVEPYFDELTNLTLRENLNLINLANGNSVYNFARYTKHNSEDGTVVFEESPYYDSELFETVNTYQKDPMLWMDPITMSAMGAVVKDYLVQKYPDNAELYETNFSKLELELAQLDSKYQTFLRENKTIQFAVMSPNFGNWQKSYGIEVYPVILSSTGKLPTAEQLEEIKVRIIQDGVIYMVVENGLPSEVEELQYQLISELGLTPIYLNSFAYTNYTENGTTLDYMGIMYQNYKVLETIAH